VVTVGGGRLGQKVLVRIIDPNEETHHEHHYFSPAYLTVAAAIAGGAGGAQAKGRQTYGGVVFQNATFAGDIKSVEDPAVGQYVIHFGSLPKSTFCRASATLYNQIAGVFFAVEAGGPRMIAR